MELKYALSFSRFSNHTILMLVMMILQERVSPICMSQHCFYELEIDHYMFQIIAQMVTIFEHQIII